LLANNSDSSKQCHLKVNVCARNSSQSARILSNGEAKRLIDTRSAKRSICGQNPT
jgi:hypothetical protein